MCHCYMHKGEREDFILIFDEHDTYDMYPRLFRFNLQFGGQMLVQGPSASEIATFFFMLV